MKINEIKVNSYGKLKYKNLEFNDGFNIVYGENEKGKSTLLSFIVNIFYGTAKTKKGKEISDFDKYKPWDTEEFSGKMKYTLDNNEQYEVFREFNKKNPKIYNKNLEDISKEYPIDKNTGSLFFSEQTKVDESSFRSTVVSFQNEVELDNQTQNVLLQKIANTSSTGDDNISYKKAMDKLNKKQLDEIGTNRSQGKPINIAIKEIENLSNINDSLKIYENYKYEIEEKKNNIENEIQKLNNKYELVNKINSVNLQQNVEKEKLKYNENKIDELENKIQQLISRRDEISENKVNHKELNLEKINIFPYIMIGILGIILSIVSVAIIKNIVLMIIGVIIAVSAIIVGSMKSSKVKKMNEEAEQKNDNISKSNNELEKKIYEINAQIELLEKSEKEQVDEAEKIKNEIINKLNSDKEKVKYEYANKIDILELNRLINSVNLVSEIDNIQKELNSKNIELHKLKLDKENILPKLEELAENEERLSYNKEIYEALKEKNNAINIAKEVLESAYQKMKSDVTPRFTKNLSNNIALVTDGKYDKVIINEEDGLLVELKNGEYKNANRLSIGTIQQLYLAFRLSMIEDISEESMPIIFDEIFAFYDDKRLKETIKNMYDNYSKKHQIILFTCTNREEKALNDLGISFNKIEL